MSVVQVIIVVTLCYQLSVFSAPSDTPKRVLDLGTVGRVRRYSEFIVRRSNWNSPDFKVPCPVTLQLPVTKVYVKETVSTNCYNFAQCKDRMLERQRWYYSFYRTDIQANFVIGGDGSIFEGLSWDCRVTYMVPDRNSILVLLIGCSECHDGDNDGQYNFQEVQYRTLDVFLKASIISGNLSSSYQLLPFCCLNPGGGDPGRKVYADLTYFKNFNGTECVLKKYCNYIL